MQQVPYNSLLFRSPRATLGYSRCGSVEPHDNPVEVEEHFTAVFPLGGLFTVSVGDEHAVATPAKVMLFGKGQAHRIGHPKGGSDHSLFILMADDVAEQGLDDRGRFRSLSAGTTSMVDLGLRRMLAVARVGHLEALYLDEFVCAVLDLLDGSISRDLATKRQREMVADAEEHLASCFVEDADLASIAMAVGSSPHYLSRWFRLLAGESLSRRRMRLRLAFALDQVLDGARDLARVAIDSGFYDHAHMTNSFRAHLRTTPSEFRSEVANLDSG